MCISLYFFILVVKAMFFSLCLFPPYVLVPPHIQTNCINTVPTESGKNVGK